MREWMKENLLNAYLDVEGEIDGVMDKERGNLYDLPSPNGR